MTDFSRLREAIIKEEPKIVQLCGVPEGVGYHSVVGVKVNVIALALYDDGTISYVIASQSGECRPQVVSD